MIFIKDLYWLWLVYEKKLTSSLIKKLLDKFLVIENIYNAKREDLENLDFLDSEKVNLLINKDLEDCKTYLNKLSSINAGIITYDDECFPKRLKRVSSFPYLLYYRGKKINLNNYAPISIVGTRNPDTFGKNATYSICENLANFGFLLVSGGAKGVDAICHKASLNKNSPPICVIGTGVDVFYPKENDKLFSYIINKGMILSEYPLGTLPKKYHFPQRNKIIAGLSFATIVTQASEKSGSLITASFSKKLNNTIFSVAGNFSNSLSFGSNSLIKEGAVAIYDKLAPLNYIKENLEDEFKDKLYDINIIEEKNNISFKKEENNDILSIDYNRYKDLSKDELLVINAIRNGNLSVDMIKDTTSIPLDKLNVILLNLELSSLIKKDAFALKYELNN